MEVKWPLEIQSLIHYIIIICSFIKCLYKVNYKIKIQFSSALALVLDADPFAVYLLYILVCGIVINFTSLVRSEINT